MIIDEQTAQAILAKLTSVEEKLEQVELALIRLEHDRYPRYVGTSEACKILGVGRTTMTERLAKGYYSFAFKENGQWQFPLNELYRFQSQL